EKPSFLARPFRHIRTEDSLLLTSKPASHQFWGHAHLTTVSETAVEQRRVAAAAERLQGPTVSAQSPEAAAAAARLRLGRWKRPGSGSIALRWCSGRP